MSSAIIQCPPGKADRRPIEIDMGHWARLESRLTQVQNVTPITAPEMLATFNVACLELNELISQIEMEHQIALREIDRVRAELIVDKIPTLLKEKGLATDRSPLGSEDLRNALIEANVDYQAAVDRADGLKAIGKLMRGKYDAFERGFRSVRTLVGEQTFGFGQADRRLSGDTGTADVGENNPQTNGFGKTGRYGR